MYVCFKIKIIFKKQLHTTQISHLLIMTSMLATVPSFQVPDQVPPLSGEGELYDPAKNIQDLVDEILIILKDPTLLHPLQLQAVAELLKRIMDGYVTVPATKQKVFSSVWTLGNGVGTGKTRVICALIYCMVQKGIHHQHATSVYNSPVEMINTFVFRERTPVYNNKILIYTDNANLIVQWQTALRQQGICFSTCETKTQCKNVPNGVNVILARGSGLQSILNQYVNQTWAFLFYDEPDTQPCKYLVMDKIKVDQIVFITATYPKLNNSQKIGYGFSHNNLVRCVMQDIQPSTLEAITVKTVSTMAQLGHKPPDVITVLVKCTQGKMFRLLNNVEPEIAGYIEQGDWDAVYATLGVQENCPSLIEAVRKRLLQQLKMWQDVVYPCQQRITMVQKRLQTFEERLKSDISDGCIICQDNPINNPTCTPCQHVFCGHCIGQWLHLHPNCPMCRTPCKLRELVCSKLTDEVPEVTDKISTIVRIVNQQTEIHGISSKTIVYGASDGGLQYIQRELAKQNVIAVILKGPSRKRVYSEFTDKNQLSQVLLLNCGQQSAGLDGLQNSCGCVVFYHSVNNKEQIIGRLDRIGQKRENIFVYELGH